MSRKDEREELPELPPPDISFGIQAGESLRGKSFYSDDTLRAYGRLCRAGLGDFSGLIEVLGYQQQCDEDGAMCAVSRQAVDEAITILRRLSPQAGGEL